MRTLRAAALIGVSFLVSSASAGERPIVIGEVSSQVARVGVDFASLLRSASEQEVRGLDVSHVPHGKRVIVSVALVRMDTHMNAHMNAHVDTRTDTLAEPRAVDATCEVSATLRDAKHGTVFAILDGRARAESGGTTDTVELSALQGALHGALARIPDVLRR